MKDDGSKRKRCTVCRSWYAPAARAKASRRVCGAECRKRRRRRLSRARRAKQVQEYRVDERRRQQECRQRRREAGKAGSSEARDGGCHAPPCSRNAEELLDKVLDSLDRAHAVSRATLRRGFVTMLRTSAAILGTERAAQSAPSRATLIS